MKTPHACGSFPLPGFRPTVLLEKTRIWVIVFLALGFPAVRAWGQATNGQEHPRPEKPLKLKGADREPVVSVRAGLEVAYDDNILDLNRKQLDQLDGGTRPEKFRIDEPDDLVTSPWLDVRFKAWPAGEPTSLGLKVQPYAYQDNPIANFEEYGAFLAQDLGRHEAGLEYKLERDVYLRELEIVVPGPNLWDSAHYSEHEVELYYRHRFTPAIEARGFAGFRRRDFDSPFDFRDLEGHYLGIRPAFEPAPDWSLFLRYEFADLESAAGAGDVDTSYRQHEIEAGTGIKFLEDRLALSLRHRRLFREYTTSNAPAVDPDHLDREDVRQRTILEARIRISKHWMIEGRYTRRTVESDRPFNTGDTSEAVGSRRQVFLLGTTYSF